ncbi:hypothetical protein B0H10DRAFT_2388379 [Mycena sp. CBHHK59/15]|nr:hypothetical protein B0H10DRAFT_2388379 [Mycena sp. CBHHK59/15]
MSQPLSGSHYKYPSFLITKMAPTSIILSRDEPNPIMADGWARPPPNWSPAGLYSTIAVAVCVLIVIGVYGVRREMRRYALKLPYGVSNHLKQPPVPPADASTADASAASASATNASATTLVNPTAEWSKKAPSIPEPKRTYAVVGHKAAQSQDDLTVSNTRRNSLPAAQLSTYTPAPERSARSARSAESARPDIRLVISDAEEKNSASAALCLSANWRSHSRSSAEDVPRSFQQAPCLKVAATS